MVAAGDPINASEINRLAPIYEQRTSDAAAISSTTLVSVMDLDLPYVGTYLVTAFVLLTNTGAVGRPGFAFGGTSTPTAWGWGAGGVHYNTATGSQGTNAAGTTYPGSTSGTAITNSDWTTTTGFSHVHIHGVVTISAVGTLEFRFSEATGSGSVNVKSRSIAIANFVP